LAGWANFVWWHAGVAVKVADKVAEAAAVCVASCSLDALSSAFIAVAALLAHTVVGAGLWDTGVSVVALKAHSAGLIGTSSTIVTSPRTYAGSACFVAEASTWAVRVGSTNFIASLWNTA
jgi:hypothetical protein